MYVRDDCLVLGERSVSSADVILFGPMDAKEKGKRKKDKGERIKEKG